MKQLPERLHGNENILLLLLFTVMFVDFYRSHDHSREDDQANQAIDPVYSAL